MSLKAAALLWLTFVPLAQSGELQQLSRGLAVNIEDMEGNVDVNGLPLAVSRVVGSDVPALVARVIDRWQADSGKDAIQFAQCCGWQFVSNIHNAQSRVLQWRNAPAGYELLWSTTDLAQQVRDAPKPTVPLLETCKWATPVSGRVAERRFVQFSARCKPEASIVLDLSTRRLETSGWIWKRVNQRLVQAERGPVQAQLIAIPEATSASRGVASRSSLVVIESYPAIPVMP
jgi:hypothetical protein